MSIRSVSLGSGALHQITPDCTRGQVARSDTPKGAVHNDGVARDRLIRAIAARQFALLHH